MAKVSIIVLQYNQSDRTLACLESLKPLNADVIVVDNNSEVQHLKNVEFWIETNKASSFQVLASRENLGYSGGNNLGIKKALADGAEQILILNNDVVLQEMVSGDADIVGLEAGRVFGFDYLSGAGLLIKRKVFEKIGFFDERYFLYYEDVEFCQRARNAGFTLALATTKFQHAVSATTRTLGKADLLYYHTRNALLLQNPRLPFGKLWIKLKQHIKIMLGREVEISRAILQGIHDYDHHRFGMRIK
ncbi:MAG: glycosyltransferase family 2 protein [Patescibacteria group bacterium]